MAEVRIVIRRVAVEETLRGIPAGNDIQCIGAFELTLLQSGCKYLGKPIPFGIDFSGGCIGCHIKPPTTGELTAERLRAKYPHGPGPFYVRKNVGIVVNDPCRADQVAAVETDSYFGFPSGEISTEEHKSELQLIMCI